MQPNETKVGTLKNPTKEMAYYNVTSKSWEVEIVPRRVLVGGSSANEDLLMGTFLVEEGDN